MNGPPLLNANGGFLKTMHKNCRAYFIINYGSKCLTCIEKKIKQTKRH